MAERITSIMKDMADAIREKTGKEDLIKGEDIPQAIRDIEASIGDYAVFYNTVDSSGKLTDITISVKSDYGRIPTNKLLPLSLKIVRLEGVKHIPADFLNFSISGLTDTVPFTTIYMDDDIETIGANAFKARSWTSTPDGLKYIYFPDGTKNRIPKKVTAIPDYCFYGCGNFRNVELHDDIKSIGKYAFNTRISKLCTIKNTELPTSLKTIGDYAFDNQQIPLTVIPASVTTIGTRAFAINEAIAVLTFLGTPTTIKNLAFMNNTKLTQVTFAGTGTPTSIDAKAFNGCTALATINVPWAEGAVANAPWGATNATINYNYTGG